MTDDKYLFQVGDEVEWCGVKGEITKNYGHTIKATFPHHYLEDSIPSHPGTDFYPDGKLFTWHTEPSLKLIKKARRVVKKTMWLPVFQAHRRQNDCEIPSVFIGTCAQRTQGNALLVRDVSRDTIGTVAIEVEVEE